MGAVCSCFRPKNSNNKPNGNATGLRAQGYIQNSPNPGQNGLGTRFGSQRATTSPGPERREQPSAAASPPPPYEQKRMVRALYSYTPQHQDDLSIDKGELMELKSEIDPARLLNPGGDAQADWLLVVKSTPQGPVEGYVPSNYVRPVEDTPQASEAWFQITRRDAERMLLWPGQKRGSYLCRPCAADVSCSALSVRDLDESTQIPQVRHYKIRQLDQGRGYYIAPTLTFPNFSSLIQHYSMGDNHGLCCRLSVVCPRVYTPPPNFKDFEWNRQAISLEKKLGGGAFGEVWMARLNRSFEVAIKSLKAEGAADDEMKRRFIEEAKVMHKLSHPKIVRLLGVCTIGSPIYIITELMPNGALYDYLIKKGPRELSYPTLIDMIAQVAEGMSYLEEHHVIHRDLRAANILVGEQNEVKVCDFGLSKAFDNDDAVYNATEEAKFPVRWTAPEAIYRKKFTTKSDIWSFGIVIFEVITYGRQPYVGMGNKEIIEKVVRGFRMSNPNGSVIGASVTHAEGCAVYCPEALYNVMLDCWQENPDSRPSFEYLHSHLDAFETTSAPNYQS